MEICRFLPTTFASLIAAIQAHLKLTALPELTRLLSVNNVAYKPISKSSLACQRSLTLAALTGLQTQQKKDPNVIRTSEACSGYNAP